MKNELTTIDREQLANTTGGDYASKWWNTLKQDYKDGQARTNAARHALLKGDVGGFAKNYAASQVDALGMVGDALAPVTGIVGAKP